MIVRHFLQWVRNAPAGARAEAISALARAYIHSELSSDDRAAVEGAMILVLDDPSPLARLALAEAVAGSEDAPPAIILALAADQPEIAAVILARSPLLLDADLVDSVGSGNSAIQAAIAGREWLPCAVAAAIAEVASAEACLVLVENEDAVIAPFSLDRIVERHGHLAAIREALLPREDLPVSTRQALIAKLSDTLAGFVTARQWMEEKRARRVAHEACDKATVAIAGESEGPNVRPLVKHLRITGQLTAGLVLRALLSGNMLLFEEALAELSELPLTRIAGLVYDGNGTGLRALCERAGLPETVYLAARVALQTIRESGYMGEGGGATRLKRRIVERVLTCCDGQERTAETQALLVLLRRFALEAARDEARLFCDELAAA